MSAEILINVAPYEVRAAVVEQGALQEILIERGPVIVFYIEKPLIGMSSALQGFEPSVPETATSYRSVNLSK